MDLLKKHHLFVFIFEGYDERGAEYREYLVSSMSAEQLKEVEDNRERIKEVFGEDAVFDIEQGDKATYFERKEERKDPKVQGFEKAQEKFPSS